MQRGLPASNLKENYKTVDIHSKVASDRKQRDSSYPSKMKSTINRSGFRLPRFVMCVVAGAGILVGSSASAQLRPLPGLGFKLDDDVATVQSALNTNVEAQPQARILGLPSFAVDPNKGQTELHLRTRGVWVFFNTAGQVYTIRLDAPFSGSVLGIKLGDSLSEVTSTLGKPVKKLPIPVPGQQSLTYVLDDSAYVRFDITDDGVQTIFVYH